MLRLVTLAAMLGGATVGVLRRHLDHMLVHVVAMHMVQVPVVQIVDMIAVAHRRVPACGPVLMCVVGVMRFLARRHGGLPAFVVGTKLRRFGANDHV
jgi:hypothetical protein